MAYLHLQIIPQHNIIRYSLQDKPFIKFQQFGCHSQQCESIFTFIYIHVVTGSSSTLFEYKRICFTLQSHHQCSFHYQCHWLPSSLSWTWLFIDNTGSSQYRLSVLSDLHAYDCPLKPHWHWPGRPGPRCCSTAHLVRTPAACRPHRCSSQSPPHARTAACCPHRCPSQSPPHARTAASLRCRRLVGRSRFARIYPPFASSCQDESSAHGFASQHVWFPSSTSLSWGAISPARLVTASHISSKVDFS